MDAVVGERLKVGVDVDGGEEMDRDEEEDVDSLLLRGFFGTCLGVVLELDRVRFGMFSLPFEEKKERRVASFFLFIPGKKKLLSFLEKTP